MLSAIVPRKIVGRCGTHAICSRQMSVSAVGEVEAAGGDPAADGSSEAQEQAGDGRLAGAARPDERDGLVRVQLEVEPVEHEPGRDG